MKLMKIYNVLPAWCQTIAVSLEGLRIQLTRYDKEFEEYYRDFMNRNDWTYAQKCEYRDAQLQKMVKHCYDTVPYYHRLFDELQIDYRDIRTLDDLQRLPILTKDIVKEHYDEFISSEYRKKELEEKHSSGTTGSGFWFHQSKAASAAVWAHVWRWYRNIGLERGTWCGYFSARQIIPPAKKDGPCCRINYPGKQIMFSLYHMNDATYAQWVETLNQYQPKWLQAFPSGLLPFAKYLEENNLRLNYIPDVITVSSESISPAQQEYLADIFGVYPVQNYAQSEAVASFYQRLDRKMFVDEDFSAVEFVPVGDDGLCKIIGTTLTNYGMPFLRYDTEDLATWQMTDLGREILTLAGRDGDNVKLRDGGMFRNLRSFVEQPRVVESQIVQKSLDLIEIHVVKGKGYSAADEKRLEESAKAALADRIGWKIVYVDRVQRNKNGKVKCVISEL